jgi:hypothetical protein
MRHFMKFCGIVSEAEDYPPPKAYPDFVPDIVVSLKRGQVVLYRDNEAMSIH